MPAIRKEFEHVNLQVSSKISKWEKNKQKRFLLNKKGKNLYKYLQKITKPRKGTFRHGILFNDTLIFDNSERAEVIAKNFANVHCADNTFNHEFSNLGIKEYLSNICFFPDQVYKVATSLKASTSVTSDEIPQIIFAKCAKSLSLPLAHIFNYSMLDSDLPSQWKKAKVIPILKPGKDPKNVGSYRPISLLCTPLKIMERLIKIKLNNFLERNNLIPEEQFGFRSKTSVTDQLLDTNTDYLEALNRKQSIDVVYFDFSKAFDKVPISKLLYKCKTIGISGKLLIWLEQYLRNRTFSVTINGSDSKFHEISSGVPQGSVLGPILFSVYISDLPNVISPELNVSIKMFADDVKIYKIMKNAPEDGIYLQAAIDQFCDWAKKWELIIAEDKCSVLHIGTTNLKNTYKVGNRQLCDSIETRDLGLYFDKKLTNKETIKQRTLKSLRTMHSILRAVKISNQLILVRCYKTYILPILEFGSPIWSPFHKKQIAQVENVQKLFTKIVYNRCGIPMVDYQQRCQALSLQTLQSRRIFIDLCLTYKILNGLTRLRAHKFFQYRVGFGRNSQPKLHPRRSRTELHKHSFSIRSSIWFSKLPPDIKSAPTLRVFKKKLKKFDIESLLLE